MWILEPVKNESSQKAGGAIPDANSLYFLRTGSFVVGRPPKDRNVRGGDILVRGDLSVSKTHAKIEVENGGRGNTEQRVLLTDLSKFGTFVNGSKSGKQRVALKEGDVVNFGTRSKFRLRLLRLSWCFGHDVEPSEEMKQQVASCGGVLERGWSSNATHVIVDTALNVDASFACGLLADIHIVTTKWLDALCSKKIFADHLPSTSEYFPAVVKFATSDRSVELNPRLCKKGILQGRKFAFIDGNTGQSWISLISLGGGRIVKNINLGSYADFIPIYKGSNIPSHETEKLLDSCEFWTNEEDLLLGILQGNLGNALKVVIKKKPPPPPENCGAEKTSAIVVSSDEGEGDYAMTSQETGSFLGSQLGKRKESAGVGGEGSQAVLSRLFNKRRCKIPQKKINQRQELGSNSSSHSELKPVISPPHSKPSLKGLLGKRRSSVGEEPHAMDWEPVTDIEPLISRSLKKKKPAPKRPSQKIPLIKPEPKSEPNWRNSNNGPEKNIAVVELEGCETDWTCVPKCEAEVKKEESGVVYMAMLSEQESDGSERDDMEITKAGSNFKGFKKSGQENAGGQEGGEIGEEVYKEMDYFTEQMKREIQSERQKERNDDELFYSEVRAAPVKKGRGRGRARQGR